MSRIKFTQICNITTGKLDANAAEENGEYPYFTCAPVPLTINSYAFDDDVVLLAGNNASGNFHCQRYKGKFNAYQRTYVITAKPGYDIEYIYYSLKINLQHFKKLAQGSQTKFLTMQILESFQVDDITFSEQRMKTQVLAQIEQKIKCNNEINAELETMAKTIYNYWFLQFEFPNEEGKPYKSSGGKMVWNEELKREIPAGWKVDSLGNLFTSNRGISYNSKTIEGDGIPMINLASFNINGSYKESGIKTYSGQYTKDKVVKPFDLLMCNTQQTAIDYEKDIIGKAFLVPDIFEGDIVTSHHVTTIQVKNDNMKYFLHRLFNTDFFHKYVAGYTNGTNILGLIFSGVEKYSLEVPDGLALKKFADLMKDIERKKSRIIKENKELVSLRDFLLPLLMNGQVSFRV